MIPRWTLNLQSTRFQVVRSNRGVWLSDGKLHANRCGHRDTSVRVLSTRERLPSKKDKPTEIIRDQFELSKQGLRYRSAEMEGKIGDIDRENISCLQVYFDETFAQTLYDITINIKRKLESSFFVMHRPDLITPEEYTDPTTKKLPLYLQPRSIESLKEGICIFYGSNALTPEKIPEQELKDFYRKVVLRLEESGFIHQESTLSKDNVAHPHDFYFTLLKTPHNKQLIQTFPNTSHHLLIANIQASVGMYKLYEDIQIAANRIPSLRHDVVHRNNGHLRHSRRPVWVPQIVLGTIVNGMDGCKKEERTLRNLCKKLEIKDTFENLNFHPKGVRMQGYIPKLSPYTCTTTTSNTDIDSDTTNTDNNNNNETTTTTTPPPTPFVMNWDFTFEHCLNAERPQMIDWVDEEWWRLHDD